MKCCVGGISTNSPFMFVSYISLFPSLWFSPSSLPPLPLSLSPSPRPSFPHHSIMANRSGNTVLFHEEGGMDVGDIDSKAHRVEVDIEDTLSSEQAHQLVCGIAPEKQG